MTLMSHHSPSHPVGRSHRKLLRAILLDEADAVEELAHWLDATDFDALDYTAFRLMPQIYDARRGDCAAVAGNGRIKGIYRYFQFRNALLMARVRETLSALSAAGITAVLFKGGAYALKYYATPALRPMADIDILIPPDSVAPAREILHRLGWEDVAPERDWGGLQHSIDYIRPDGLGLDVHWHALVETQDPSFSAGLIGRARGCHWNGLETQVLCPEDLILTSLCNAMREPEAMRLEWIPDILTLLAAEPDIDWPALWRTARRYGLYPAVLEGLRVAQEALDSPALANAIETMLTSDTAFLRQTLLTTLAEGRADTLTERGLAEAARLAAETAAATAPDALRQLDTRPGHPRYLRFSTHPCGSIRQLWLHRTHLPRITEVFEVVSRWRLHRILRHIEWDFAGTLSLPPGVLRLRDGPMPRTAYRTALRLADPVTRITARPGQCMHTEVFLANTSTRCWPVYGDSPRRIALSVHLLDARHTPLVWDNRRSYPAAQYPDRITLILPGDELACRLSWEAPTVPGHYTVSLDVVHEHVKWFSQAGNRMPVLDLEVLGPPAQDNPEKSP